MDVYVYMHFLLSSLIFCPEGWTSAFLLLARFHLVAHPVGSEKVLELVRQLSGWGKQEGKNW